ncbi:MAG: GNAT family N-acetyltransferase, partial [Elusimicrobia bacterium]|nr:GNAT family N-acetyltransferase [Elusimicrobiota bacterium]
YVHWLEAGDDQASVGFFPDWPAMCRLNRAGAFRVAALRKDGELIGYNAFHVTPHILYGATLYALNQGVYVEPQHRGFAGGKLLLGSEKLLREAGVGKVVYSVPVANKKLDAVLGRLGYSLAETFRSKLLG